MSDKNKVVVEGSLQLEEVVSYLENLVSTLKAGTIHIQQGLNSVTLRPTSIVDVKIEASQKEGKEKLSVKVAWSGDPKYGVTDGISISTDAPKLDIA